MACLDITNYAYIWYKKDLTKLLEFTSDEKEIIYNIIINFSYPCYLANNSIRDMSLEDKKELLECELLFIRKKIEETCLVDINIMQIPRVLYDLFNLNYYYTYNPKNIKDIEYNYNNETIQNKNSYNSYTFHKMEIVKKNIFELNYIIINYIACYLIGDITLEYHNILESLIEQYNKKEIFINFWRYNSFFNIEQKNILHEILDFEVQPNSGFTILYRGANIEKDSIIRKKQKILRKKLDIKITYYNTKAQDEKLKSEDEEITILELNSLSLNMSILSGFINDIDSCTLNYIVDWSFRHKRYDKDNKKIKYTIKKFNLDDSSNEFSLFFIPPIHPFLQLYCKGEFWHPRTKIGNNFCLNIDKISIFGIYAHSDFFEFIKNCDYLISNKTVEELEEIYQTYRCTNKITFWKKKYLKYKKKYLEYVKKLEE
jgi:hypothetical protein